VCDSNWGLFDRDVLITQWIIDSKLQTGYPAILDVTFAKNNPERVQQIVELDHRAGTDLLRGVGLSIQTFSPEALTRISRFNMQDHKTHQALKFYHENQIPTWSEMIWPLPGETLASFRSSLQKLLDLGQHGFLSVHPLVVTYNAPMSRPGYIHDNGIQMQDVLLDQFWAEISYDDVVPERVDAVKSTQHITFDEMIQGHLFAHWLVVLYYYGWAHYVLRWLNAAQGRRVTDLVQDWIDYWCQQPHSWIAQEHEAVAQSLRGVFEQGRPWGRRIEQGGNVMWEYKSGTCVGIHHRREQWSQWLGEWLEHSQGCSVPGLVDLNMRLCVDWRQQYPFLYDTDPVLSETLLGLPGPCIRIDHADRGIQDDLSFVKKAYHLRRRNLYWRCRASNP
jgi:putative methyltransferase